MTQKDNILTLVKKMRIVSNETALESELTQLSPNNVAKPLRIGFINAHGLNLCYENPIFLQNMLDCDRVYRDGSGMKILCKMLGIEPGLNLNGTDLIPQIIERYQGSEAALLGTERPYLDNAARKIADMGVRVSVIEDGFRQDDYYVQSVKEAKPPLIILAMGMPKQERVAGLIAQQNEFPTVIVCGGAILDFMGEKVKRAPYLFRSLGIEWVYRLLQEPKRLFKRYIIGNAIFLVRGILLALHKG